MSRSKRKLLIRETLLKTKKSFYRALENLMSLVSMGYHKLPKPCFQTLDAEKWEPKSMEQGIKEHFTSDRKRESNSKEDRIQISGRLEPVTRKYLRAESRYLAAEALARKMKELDMMDVNDMDHVLDVEEALSYYSRLTCPAYQHIIDKFFMDMYLEFNDPEPERELEPEPEPSKSLNNSMRKVGSGSFHSSRRSSLGPVKL